VDAIRRADGITWVHVPNEEAGAFAAAAEAQLTGRLAVCAGSCGPGKTHLTRASTTRIAAARPSSQSPRISRPSRSVPRSSRGRPASFPGPQHPM
jgi:hypothetical protein